MKDTRTLIFGSPLVMIQMIIMVVFVISATLEAITQFKLIGAIIYAVVLSSIYILALVSMVQTFVTHPGEVTQQLIDRLKSQLLHPK